MRALMGLIKDRHGTYYAQRKVPKHLQQAVARVLNSGKPKQVFLKKSLGTKSLREANIHAKPVLMDFDRTFERASALLVDKPLRGSLSRAEIRRITEYHFASVLAEDDLQRQSGREQFSSQERQMLLDRFGVNAASQDDVAIEEVLENAQEALAESDLTHIKADVDGLLDTFCIRLDEASEDYKRLSLAVLQEQIKAYRALRRRSHGEPIDTPVLTGVKLGVPSPDEGGTLRDALEGWKKERARPAGTVQEYARAIEMFIQLHGDLPVVQLKRSHARAFREALQEVPRVRKGNLREAPLAEVVEWSRKHPQAAKVSPGTVNKQIGAVQAIAGWARENGIIPDDAAWSDPFQKMRVEEEQSEREPF
jgi:hypothetical protein